MNRWSVIVVAVVVPLVAGLVGCGGHHGAGSDGRSTMPRSTSISAAAPPLAPAEGMWLFEALPAVHLRQTFGFDPTPAWANHLRLASAHAGASASFVSADGLVLTNHHVALRGLHNVSSTGHDYVARGFLARSRDQEIPLPGMELSVLESIEDVTARINDAVPPNLSPDLAVKARHAAMSKLERQSLERTGLQSSVITLYGGARYHLYRYKRYTDIRVAFAPEVAAAFFGGDPDNFEYPRYDLDMALLRAYENGRPAHVKHYLKFSRDGVQPGELVFVSGNPAHTDRLLPVVSLEAQRDLAMPLRVEGLEREERVLLTYSAAGPEQAREAREDLFGVQNALKATRPRLAALRGGLMAEKAQQERAFRAELRARPNLSRFGGAWDQAAAVEQRRTGLLLPFVMIEEERAFATPLFAYARELVRLPDEDARPDEQRLREYTRARRAPLEHRLLADDPIYPDLEIAKLAESLTFFRDRLGADAPLVQRVLAGQTPADRAAQLVHGTRLGSAAERRRLLRGGAPAIAQSDDAMIRLARQIDADARALRRTYEAEVEEPQTQALTEINRARFALFGSHIYPDATGTLRLSFGLVEGYAQDGQTIPPWTTIGGAFQHEQRHGGAEPYRLPQSWHDARARLNPAAPLNFVCTADIIGGNSGSPVVNRAGELVGLLFDSNRQGVPNDFAYTDVQARAVCVDVRGMLESMRNIYGADSLVAELTEGH